MTAQTVRLHWTAPADLVVEKARNIERAWTSMTAYDVEFREGTATEPAHFQLVRREPDKPYFEPVPLDPSATGERRWLPLQEALGRSDMYRPEHYDAVRSLAAAKRVTTLDPTEGVLTLAKWLDAVEESLMTCPREQIAATCAWIEDEVAKRLGRVTALPYLRTHEAFAAMQALEMLGKFDVVPAPTLAEFVANERQQELLAEDAHSHGNANFFTIPLAIAYPEWLGQSMRSVSWQMLFVLDEPRVQPYLDATHRDIWNGWVSSWYAGESKWESLLPARPAAFVQWYVERLNALLSALADPATTASASGQIRPIEQLSLLRSPFRTSWLGCLSRAIRTDAARGPCWR